MGADASVIIAVILGLLLLAVLVVKLSVWLQWFRRELRYLNKEIQRTSGEEKQQWIKRKKKLYLSILPFMK